MGSVWLCLNLGSEGSCPVPEVAPHVPVLSLDHHHRRVVPVVTHARDDKSETQRARVRSHRNVVLA